ncbi:flavonol synthase/flavanone 3-hydroxylase-like isoform X2 [Carex littledalei]|uniref:Flavonol synthase/flavanone 3-hydroxylase-like isoform X2 n=1 Tax=Carex littledalei TaxID=544730 RepID=A0A833VDT9_9POAL|nr:flavonol synthase/flavanone 3-hydroxylase-like isoform X2 [Carex littledalei]
MDSLLQDWPEPVVCVQSLSESGLSTIPDRYIKPPSDRPSLSITSKQNQHSIPVVDLRGLMDDVAGCRATIQAISAACREWGFFQVVNHGVSVELMERMRETWRSFFQLPIKVKQAYANLPKTYEGYGSRLGVEKGAILDWGDYYFLNLMPASARSRQMHWPAQPCSLREITNEYEREVAKLCQTLMKVLSISLGLDVDYLQNAFGGGGGAGECLRVNYYPKCPQPDLALGLSPHSDPGGLTVLLADHRVGGLQVRKGDAWVTVQPLPAALVINIGDQIQVLSNCMFKSVEHRVLTNPTNERISMAFFYNPRSDLPLAPAQELVTPERPSLYRPMTFDEYRMYIRKKGPRGKTQVESLKAQ